MFNATLCTTNCCDCFYLIDLCACADVPDGFNDERIAIPCGVLDPLLNAAPAPSGWPGTKCPPASSACSGTPPYYGCDIIPPHKGLMFLMLRIGARRFVCARYCWDTAQRVPAVPEQDPPLLIATGVIDNIFSQCAWTCFLDEGDPPVIHRGCCDPDECPPTPLLIPCNGCLEDDAVECKLDINSVELLSCENGGPIEPGCNRNICVTCGGVLSPGPDDFPRSDTSGWRGMGGFCPVLADIFGAPEDCTVCIRSDMMPLPHWGDVHFGACCPGISQCCPAKIELNEDGDQGWIGWGLTGYTWRVLLWCRDGNADPSPVDDLLWTIGVVFHADVGCGTTHNLDYPNCLGDLQDPLTLDNRYKHPLHCSTDPVCQGLNNAPDIDFTAFIFNTDEPVDLFYDSRPGENKWRIRLRRAFSRTVNLPSFVHSAPGCNVQIECFGLNLTMHFRKGPNHPTG
jgi:hypothetical protein